MPHMKNFLDAQGIPFHIFIVEQGDAEPFNRAKLLNVGFKETEDFDYFCFHDVDMLPVESDYSSVSSPTHLAASVEQFNWGLAYETYFGGVTLFPKDAFRGINGYSNNYWGWGAEDDDLWNRCIQKKFFPTRKPGKYSSLNHERVIDQGLWRKNYEYLRAQDDPDTRIQVIESDGISSLYYEKLAEENINEYTTKIIVKL